MAVSDFFEKAFLETVGTVPKTKPLEDTSQYVVDTIHENSQKESEAEADSQEESEKKQSSSEFDEVIGDYVYKAPSAVLKNRPLSEESSASDELEEGVLNDVSEFRSDDAKVFDEEASYADDMDFSDGIDEEEISFDDEVGDYEEFDPYSDDLDEVEDDDFNSLPAIEDDVSEEAEVVEEDYVIDDSMPEEYREEFEERDPEEVEEQLRVQVEGSATELKAAKEQDSITRMSFSKVAIQLIKHSVISSLSNNANSRAAFLANKVLDKKPTQADFMMAWIYAHADLALAQRFEEAGVISNNAKVLATAIRPENAQVTEHVMNIESHLAESAARSDELADTLNTVLVCGLIAAANSLGVLSGHDTYGKVENFKLPNPELNHILSQLRDKLS